MQKGRHVKKWILIVSIALIVVGALGAWHYRWSTLPSYPDVASVDLPQPIQTTEEHDLIDHPTPYSLELSHGGGSLMYIGVAHTKDADDEQIALIKTKWAEFKPTIALCEGRLGFFIGGLDLGVGQFGEPGAVYRLARANDVPVYTLEPDIPGEVADLLERWSPQKVALFYVLRTYMSDRRSEGSDNAAAIVAKAISKRTRWPGLEGSIRDVAHLDSLFRTQLPQLGDWRTMPEEAMWPGDTTTYLNLIATRSSYFRDVHMVRLLSQLIRKGERVFAVVGACHVVMQETALRALLAEE
jgi:hypothetical protein